jgi:hypothetical protein
LVYREAAVASSGRFRLKMTSSTMPYATAGRLRSRRSVDQVLQRRGDGAFWSESHGFLLAEGSPQPSAAQVRAAQRQDEVWDAAPRVEAPSRRYLLFSGPLSVVDDLAEGEGAPDLSMWWPGDRAWLVSTEVDAITSYVGGSREIIDALLADESLDAVEGRLNSPLDPRR